MLSEILNAVAEFFQSFLFMFLPKELSRSSILPSNMLRVFIKHNFGPSVNANSRSSNLSPSSAQTVAVDLDINWSIRQVKEMIAPKLHLQADEIKIIFAGKELPDELILQTCNVGQQSFLHAVKVQIKSHEVKSNSTTLENLVETNIEQNNILNHKPYNEDLITAPAHEEESSTEFSPLSSTEVNTNQSEFFVYCEKCGGLREGKLRVRCSVCQSGAFTVLRDPENWEDVMKPNQVPGSCETLECSGYFSQFYFKCRSHITSGEDDSSCPLPQIKHNPELVPCLACGDSKDPVFVFECPSKHVACVDCFQQYALLKTNERQFVLDQEKGYTLECPAKCDNSLITDTHHFKLMGKYQYDRYQRFATEEAVLQAGGVLCPQPNCGMGILPMDEGCNKIACLHGCGFVFCRICLEGWHMGACSRDSSVSFATGSSSGSKLSLEYTRVARAQWDDDTRRALRLSTKPCPNCRVATERAGGCMHMECSKCNFQWCWVCQNKWTRDCMGNHWFG